MGLSTLKPNFRHLNFQPATIAIILYVLSHGIQIFCTTYATALFLSSYARTWLPYFFILQSGIDTLILLGIRQFLFKKPQQNALKIMLSYIVLIIIFMTIMPIKWQLTPLLFSLLLLSLVVVIEIITWSFVLLSFHIIDFKFISQRATTFGIAADIAFGFLATLLIRALGNQALLNMVLLLIAINIWLFYQLKPIHSPHKLITTSLQSLYRYPLFRQLFVVTFLMTLAFIFVDYALKVKLNSLYSFRQIGEFIGIFLAVSNIIAFVLHIFVTKRIMQRYGASGLLLTFPVFCIASGILVVLFPHLWSISILAAGTIFAFFGTVKLGKEIFISILPDDMRYQGQFRLRTVATPLAIITGALTLTKSVVSIPTLALLIIAVCMINIFFIVHLQRHYAKTLRDQMQLKRFSFTETENILNITHQSDVLTWQAQARKAAYQALQHTYPTPLAQQHLQRALHEKEVIHGLRALVEHYHDRMPIINELQSRITMVQYRFLYWLASYRHTRDVIGLIPTIMGYDVMEQAKAVELLNTLMDDPTITTASLAIFFPTNHDTVRDAAVNDYLDPWLRDVIEFVNRPLRRARMDHMQIVVILRQTELFKTLPGEILLQIAEEITVIKVIAGQTIFKQGDAGDGLYIIANGEINIIKNQQPIATLQSPEFFGELALLDNEPRSTTLIAHSDSVLLFLDKIIFERITDDMPDVLRAVVKVVLRYLRSYMQQA